MVTKLRNYLRMQSEYAGPGASVRSGDDIPGRHAELALGCFASICRDRLADELLVFSRQEPDVDIGVHEMARGALLPALKAGDLSLIVMPGDDEPDVRSRLVWHDRVVVAMPPDHPLAAKPSIMPSELLGQPFLVSRQQFGGDMHRFLTRLILPAGPALTATILDKGPARIVEQIAEGSGMTLLCESHIEHLAARVATRPVDAPGAIFPVRAYWRDVGDRQPLAALIRSLQVQG